MATVTLPKVSDSQPGVLSADLAIIGGGPSGLSAAISAAADGISTVLIEGQSELGGQIKHTAAVENLLGFDVISGHALISHAARQAQKFGVNVITGVNVAEVIADGDDRVLRLNDGRHVASRAAVIASGLAWKHLVADGERDYLERGVYYGPMTTKAHHAQGKVVAIIGGANSAGQAALHWATYASHVYVIVRGAAVESSMSAYLVERVTKHPKITVLTETQVTRVYGDRRELTALEIDCKGDKLTLPCECCLVFIGSEPRTEWLSSCGVERNSKGFIVTDAYYRTNLPGVFAIGDVRDGIAKRVSAALGDGSGVVAIVNRHLKSIPIP